ncbi:hypothetical protein MSG28_000056 [Choristoneura fumiferana]|uniref:Uncharacterized protein n=1 Tax=Choristoneura fumiferana TaxID=7141 RepID=A0ACC0JZM9_CHOFU|nr:hypothetical protein MSG28_000056 [Choristoneura fumiferana]
MDINEDMFNVNEYLALELLHTAQRQMPRHPGLPRGLLAVVLYYDGRRALVQALKELLTARDGVCWKLLAGVVFSASAQRGLERDVLLRLINEQTTAPSQGPTGALDEVSLALQMALLYALDLSVLHRREDGEELAKKLPLIQDATLITVAAPAPSASWLWGWRWRRSVARPSPWPEPGGICTGTRS